MTLFVKLCATQEGFFLPGSLPARDHNPMDLRHAPHTEHDASAPNAIGREPDDATGFADAERQAQLWASRGDTLKQAIYTEAPPGVDGNNAAGYLAHVIAGFGGRVDEDTSMVKVLEIMA